VSHPLRIELPTPFPIGTVNAYLLRGEPLTLVDAGARTPESLAALEATLRAEGLRVEDLELLVLTHHHVDHAGLAETVRARSGCDVAAHGIVGKLLRDLPATRAAQDAWAAALLQLHGAPEDVVETVAAVSGGATGLSESVDVGRELAEGDKLVAGGRELHVLLRPGHSVGDTLFVDRDGWAIVGDHLLSIGPSVAVAERPAGDHVDPRRRPQALLGYRESLASTATLGLEHALTGHGPPVDGPAAAIEARVAVQYKRAARLRRELESGPRTAWELVETIRGGRVLGGEGHPISEAYVVFSDIVAHLDLLTADGRAHELNRDDGCVVFAAA
jgi:glyoxylase-like metal-dependent hydrolase (beta-lactamase superfamily II)